jgi:hypothetical protein
MISIVEDPDISGAITRIVRREDVWREKRGWRRKPLGQLEREREDGGSPIRSGFSE